MVGGVVFCNGVCVTPEACCWCGLAGAAAVPSARIWLSARSVPAASLTALTGSATAVPAAPAEGIKPMRMFFQFLDFCLLGYVQFG